MPGWTLEREAINIIEQRVSDGMRKHLQPAFKGLPARIKRPAPVEAAEVWQLHAMHTQPHDPLEALQLSIAGLRVGVAFLVPSMREGSGWHNRAVLGMCCPGCCRAHLKGGMGLESPLVCPCSLQQVGKHHPQDEPGLGQHSTAVLGMLRLGGSCHPQHAEPR